MKSLPEGLLSNLSSLVLTLRSSSNTLPLPFYPIENFVPLTPVQFIRETLPALVTLPRASVLATLVFTVLIEYTAFKLAKQLRNFQGYTYEQYHEAD